MAYLNWMAGADPSMVAAATRARETFHLFWRELSWERRRIVPALGLAVVKFPFADPGRSSVEQMWVDNVEFDGKSLHGRLVNQPNELRSIKRGAAVSRPLEELSDWMFALEDQVFGGFSVAAIRGGMSDAQREEHDQAWGLDFGDWRSPRLPDANAEHPMALNMLASLEAHLRASPDAVKQKDARGWTLLHHMAAAGSPSSVRLLMRTGADANARTNDGLTAAELARAVGWPSLN
jgi:uncharacterized protein YegJ (DUF2314 family)